VVKAVNVNPVVSQSVPSSNASSDNDVRTSNQGNIKSNASTAIQSAQIQQQSSTRQQTSSQTSSIPSPSSSYNPLPLKRDASSSVCDDEYARFMRSIIGDDQSILTFRTLQSIKTKQGGGSVMGNTSVMGSAFETLDEDDVSYQLTSDEEDDDDDDDDMEMEDNEESTNNNSATQSSPQKTSTAAFPSTPMNGNDTDEQSQNILPNEELMNDDDLLNVFGEIEGLMEEDLEAAVMASLIGGPSNDGELSNAPSSWGVSSTANRASRGGMTTSNGPPSRGPSNNTGAIMGTLQQKAITTPGQSTKKQKSTTTVVTTPSPCMGKDRHANAGATNTCRSGALEVPAVSKDQLKRLRSIMARHHQLLLQQATLSVRAAYVQKVRKDNCGVTAGSSYIPSAAHSNNRVPTRKANSVLPASRLDTRSLTFCSVRPSDGGCTYVNDFFGGETPEDLSECLDGAVGMLQDLEQNWKDAVRNSIQLPPAVPRPPTSTQVQGGGSNGGRRNLKFGESEPSSNSNMGTAESSNDSCRRLTRSAFTKTLLEREMEMTSSHSPGSYHDNDPSSPTKHHPSLTEHHHAPISRISVFDVRGLSRLKETFSALDNSVKDIQMGREKGKNEDGINILAPDVHGKACEILLKHARAEISMEYLPGAQPDQLGRCLTHAPEAFDEPDKVYRPLTKKQEAELRRNRHTFTAGEDNLILRGVNLYGEKEWCLVSDRFLPDRVVNSIAQRYNKLCFLIYKANDIEINDKGKMGPIPTFPKGSAFDMTKVLKIKPARAPTTMNVHRWTLEEDIAILKAVPVMGNLWAEICTKLMPHRDRGHIRKRFQVLQRRLPKGITKMNMKYLKRPAEQQPVLKPPRSPKRARVPRSPAKKKVNKKAKATTTKTTVSKPPATMVTAAAESRATAASRAAARPSPAEPPVSPARIFQQAARVVHKRPPMSPIKSAPPPQVLPKLAAATPPKSPSKAVRPFMSNRGSRALSQALEAVASSEVEQRAGEPSPETRVMAHLLGGFSQSSRLGSFPTSQIDHDENSQMGVEKILGSYDDWSQASGMQRLIEAGAAESNMIFERNDQHQHHGESGSMPLPQSPTKSSELPMYQVHDGEASGLSVFNSDHHTTAYGETAHHGPSSHLGGEQRKSILSSVMEKTKENALKRKSSAIAFPTTPTKQRISPSRENVLPANPAGYPSSIPTSAISFNLGGTPSKEKMGLGLNEQKGELTMNHEFFDYFMSDKSRQPTTPGRAGTSPTKTSMMMSPIKIGNMALSSTTPLSQFGTLRSISGPMMDGENSLLMHASDFDAVAALKDLSNSAPSTPSKLHRPRDSARSLTQQDSVPYNRDDDDDANKEAHRAGQVSTRKKPRTSFFGKVKAKVEERKTG